MFRNSYLRISSHGISATIPMVVINDVEFYNSNWEFHDTYISITNSNTSLLYLNVNLCNRHSNLTNFKSIVNIQNCTIGCWKFKCINDLRIKDSFIENSFCCNKIFMDITNSSVILDNISVHGVNINCPKSLVCGLVFDLMSRVLMKNSFYGKNINSSISVMNGSTLVIENCTITDNDVIFVKLP